ncbi:Protein of unknown function [Lentzea albidocapillata subsp. violacea]|uniref:DUF1761 domain-containing protein n=1 Tax=Lentzea albidocapillata subsp. violacea TaxID=128104 RepID=A0A1G8ZGU3_9PSEU|nr:DUF1761 domain-containing protein [Lentzea albidocapillata]SDK14213.1 Protein of unknown function [Lentzea albidocapillata subsp. violacea]
MSLTVLGDLNWWAVVVATIAYFALSLVWYADYAFGRAWQRAAGWDLSPPEKIGVGVYAIPLVTCFVITLATAMIGHASRTDDIMEGILLGLVVGLGIALPIRLMTGAYDMTKPAPVTFAAIGAGYHIVGLTLAGAILGLWI